MAGALLSMSVTALGAGAAAAAGDGKADAKDPSRRVCRMITPTGSRLAIRSCRTQAEWDAITKQSQEGADAQRRNDETVRPGAFTTAF